MIAAMLCLSERIRPAAHTAVSARVREAALGVFERYPAPALSSENGGGEGLRRSAHHVTSVALSFVSNLPTRAVIEIEARPAEPAIR